MSGKKREKWVDFAKCIAIFIVMLNHSGIVVPAVSFFGGMFYVPIFFLISGFTYRTKEESFPHFVKRKAKRLLLPYITANMLLFAFFFCKETILEGGSKAAFLRLFGILYGRNQLFAQTTQTLFLPQPEQNLYLMTCLNSPTWFLPALFLTIVLFEMLMRLTDKNGRKMWLVSSILLFLAILYHNLFPVLLPWSLDAVPLFLQLFMWGYFIRRKAVLYYLDQKKWLVGVIAGCFLLTAWMNGSANFSVADYGTSMMLALFNALASSVLVFYFCFKIRRHIPAALAWIGRQTLPLLCYHLFVFSIFQTVLCKAPAEVHLLLTIVTMTLLCYGKEKLWHAKRQRT